MDIQDLTQLPKTRQEAIDIGSKYYFNSNPCLRGHTHKRETKSGRCITCKNQHNLQYMKNVYPKNRDKLLSYQREYYLKNTEKVRLRVNDWEKNNKEKVRENALNSLRKRRAKLKNIDGKFTKKQCDELLKKQKYKCTYCKCDIKLKHQADHIIPIYLNGSNDIKNIQMLCPPCNKAKGKKHPIDFAKSKGLLI